MPNHWHFVLRPMEDGQLTAFLRCVAHTHTMRWHAHYHTSGTGHLYQGRFKAFPVEDDDHFHTVISTPSFLHRGSVRRAKRVAGRVGGKGSVLRKKRGRDSFLTVGRIESRPLFFPVLVSRAGRWLALRRVQQMRRAPMGIRDGGNRRPDALRKPRSRIAIDGIANAVFSFSASGMLY